MQNHGNQRPVPLIDQQQPTQAQAYAQATGRAETALAAPDRGHSALSALIQRVETGEEIIIARRGKPVVRLVPEPHAHDNAAEVFRRVWSLGGLDMTEPSELSLDSVDLD